VKQTRILMGMPVTLEVVDPWATEGIFDAVYSYFKYVDDKFSTYKETSEISLINRKEIALEHSSEDMREVFSLAEQTKEETNGFFEIRRVDNGIAIDDPSGLVKGWAIYNAADILRQEGFENYYVDAGGDIQAVGQNSRGQNWRVGIRNPFNLNEIVKVLSVSNRGVATSGTYVRGQHIYNTKNGGQPIKDIMSLTVVGPDVYEADRFATAAFAMGGQGIHFIESLESFEGYMIDRERRATFTSGFERYVAHD
jgi:thiamine biosynthesis lipoprotein